MSRYSSSDGTREGQLFTYDDIERYSFVRYKGDAGWVLDKGEHIVGTSRSRHMYIQLVDLHSDEEDARLDDKRIHERIVNRAIREGDLWVDWNNTMNPTQE